MLMNFCRWLGTPTCGYEQACVGVVSSADGAPPRRGREDRVAAAALSVQTAVCAASAPGLQWGFLGAAP